MHGVQNVLRVLYLKEHLHHDLLYRGGGVDAQLGHVAVLGEEDGEIVIT